MGNPFIKCAFHPFPPIQSHQFTNYPFTVVSLFSASCFFFSIILTCSSKSYFFKKPHNYNSSLTTHPSLATPVLQSSLYCLHFLSIHLPTPKTPIKAGFNHYMKPMQSNLIPLQQSALLTIPLLSLSFFGFRDNCWSFPVTTLVNPLSSSKVLFIYQSFKHCYTLKILSLAFSSHSIHAGTRKSIHIHGPKSYAYCDFYIRLHSKFHAQVPHQTTTTY